MKRNVLTIFCLAILVWSAAAFAEEDASVPEPFVFSFRNGVTWESTPEQVQASEIAEEVSRDTYLEESGDERQYILYADAAVSKFTADLTYYFLNNRLMFMVYDFRDWLSENEYTYLAEALAYKYGQPLPPDEARFAFLMNATSNSEPLDPEGEEYREILDEIVDISNWQLQDGTYIVLGNISEDQGLIYINEDALLRARGIYNTMGL